MGTGRRDSQITMSHCCSLSEQISLIKILNCKKTQWHFKQEELEATKSVDVEGGLWSQVLLENHLLPACARQAALQPVCGTCRSPGLTCTLAEQVKGIQDYFVETTYVPEPPIHSITPLLWPLTPRRSFPVTLLPRRVLEGSSHLPAQPTGSVCAKSFSGRMTNLGLWHSLSVLEGSHCTGGRSFLDVRSADIPTNIPPGKDLEGGGRDEIRLSMNFPWWKRQSNYISLSELCSCLPGRRAFSSKYRWKRCLVPFPRGISEWVKVVRGGLSSETPVPSSASCQNTLMAFGVQQRRQQRGAALPGEQLGNICVQSTPALGPTTDSPGLVILWLS